MDFVSLLYTGISFARFYRIIVLLVHDRFVKAQMMITD